MSWWDSVFGGNTNTGLAASGNGTGNFASIPTGDGSFVGVNQDAYNTWVKAGGTGAKAGESSSLPGILGAGAGLLSAGGSIMNALTGMQALGLAKKQFEYEKALSNANLHNSATQINNVYDQQARVGNALSGNSITDAQKQASLDAAAAKHLKTTI